MRFHLLFFTLTLCLKLSSQAILDNHGKMAFNSDKNVLFSTEGYYPCLALVNGSATDSSFSERGIIISAKFGNIWSLRIPIASLESLKDIRGIEFAELSSPINSARIKNDIERQLTKVDKVQNGLQNSLPKNYSGKGVIVGIVDIGFQCNHPNFYTVDGSRNRISRFWMQGNNNGPAPDGFTYGTEYKDSNVIPLLNDMDGTHGTHVAGIAAGSGHTSPNLQYRGMAPDAELVFVGILYGNDSLPGSSLGDYIVANPSILDAYKYIFDYAESVGKPAVINLSWGMHTGPHDGKSLFDLATESLVGQGKILVGSSGNEGDNPMHWFHAFDHDTVGTIMIENGRQWRQGENVYSDFWGYSNKHFGVKIKIIDTNFNKIVETPFILSNKDTSITYNLFADNSVFQIHFACTKSYPTNQKPNITVSVSHVNQRKYAILAYIHSDSSEVHAWNSGAARDWTSGSFRNRLNNINFEDSFIAGNTDYTAGENGGTSKAVISVGAIAARSAYFNVNGILMNDSSYVIPPQIARFSSRGPTVDGRIKPNIVAPGYDVPSSINNRQFAGWMIDRTVLKSVFKNDTQYWSTSNGTSMSAPHVTGIIALLLEANPKLSAAQAEEILETTADIASYMGAMPNYT